MATSLAASQSFFGNIGGAVGDIFTGIGQQQSAKTLRIAARYAGENADLAETSTRIQRAQLDRQAYRTIGGQKADVAGAGFSASGSALDLLRDSMAEAAMADNLTALQGQIEVNAYTAQQKSLLGQAKQADIAAKGSFIGSIFKVIAGVAALAI